MIKSLNFLEVLESDLSEEVKIEIISETQNLIYSKQEDDKFISSIKETFEKEEADLGLLIKLVNSDYTKTENILGYSLKIFFEIDASDSIITNEQSFVKIYYNTEEHSINSFLDEMNLHENLNKDNIQNIIE